MIGICSYSGYVPRFRINRMTIYSAMGWMNPAIIMNAAGEKPVASCDEDSITMAVAAGMRCLEGFNPSCLEALYFATTTAPYKERQNANIIAGALCAPKEIRSADFGGSLKAGTSALLSALELVASGGGKLAAVTAADCRLGKSASVQEMIFGDGAAAVLVGDEDVIAAYKGFYSLAVDFVDHLRGANSRFDRQWEERWIRDLGYERLIPEVVEGLCRKYNLQMRDFSKIIYPCHYNAARKAINLKLGLNSGQVQDNLLMETGDTGAAHSLVMLAKALEDASPGDRLLVVGYGSGCDALWFEVTEKIDCYADRKRLTDSLLNRAELESYTKYLVWKGLVPADTGLRAEEDHITRWSLVWRNHKAILGLQGTLCRECGTQQFPPQRVCANPDCGAVDQMEPVSLSGKGGKILSYTSDLLAATVNPPAFYGNVDFNGGGRSMFDFTDCTLEDLQVGKAVKFTFRIKYYDAERDIVFYFWKAVPVNGEVS